MFLRVLWFDTSSETRIENDSIVLLNVFVVAET